MKKIAFLILAGFFISSLLLAGDVTLSNEPNIKWNETPKEKLLKLLDTIEQTPQEETIAREFAEILNRDWDDRIIVKFVNEVVRIYFSDDTFAKSFHKNAPQSARFVLDFFLIKTGRHEATIEFYNLNRIKMFSISGNFLNAELTSCDFYR